MKKTPILLLSLFLLASCGNKEVTSTSSPVSSDLISEVSSSPESTSSSSETPIDIRIVHPDVTMPEMDVPTVTIPEIITYKSEEIVLPTITEEDENITTTIKRNYYLDKLDSGEIGLTYYDDITEYNSATRTQTKYSPIEGVNGINQKTETTFDEQDRVVSIKIYREGDGSLIKNHITEYDDVNHVVEKYDLYPDREDPTKEYNREITQYDENGVILSEAEYGFDEDGNEVAHTQTTYTYNEDETIARIEYIYTSVKGITYTAARGVIEYTYTYTDGYLAKTVVSTLYYDQEDALINGYLSETQYDSQERRISYISGETDDGQQFDHITSYSNYTYDDTAHTQKEEHGVDDVSVGTYYYTRITQYDDNGNRIRYYYRQYDADGNTYPEDQGLELYSYDSQQRIISETHFGGTDTLSLLYHNEYVYDDENHTAIEYDFVKQQKDVLLLEYVYLKATDSEGNPLSSETYTNIDITSNIYKYVSGYYYVRG